MKKKGESGEFKYLLMALFIIFGVGLLSYIAAGFSDLTPENYDGYLSPLVNFVSAGYNFHFSIPVPILPDMDLDFNFNPFSLFGDSIQNFLTTQLLSFALLPGFIAIPLIIIIVFAFGYFLIKIIQGFIP